RIGVRQPIFFCRIGIRQPRYFRYRLFFGNEKKLKRWADEDVNHPGFWVDEEVNHPEEQRAPATKINGALISSVYNVCQQLPLQ
ncbi:MAG TPA: hypothetical protein PLL35_02520, partial [Candidatus Cloacimonas sp.]|nr:hypothetical protein [Candidatus Cloacimonas sp.]